MSSRDPRAASTSHAWHAIGIKELAAHFATDLQQGLTGSEAVSRLAANGPNELPSTPPVSAFRILLRQFTNLIVAVLLGAALLSGWLQDWMDAGAILVIVLLNGALGFVQEHKAERSLSALKRLSQTTAHVIRDGQSRTVAARELARGDVIEIDAGDRVPADVALVYAAALRTQEASLTGESVPVTKRVETLPAQTALADRANMLFVGTTVSAGKGRGVVVATGLDTELGRMSTLVETAERESTPFQRRWEDLGRVLLFVALAVAALVFVLGMLRGEPFLTMFLTAVSLAVAAIPEAVPAIVTMTLAIGVTRMVARHAVIRRLQAVETLGATTVLCTDKTGTLTMNEMTVVGLYAGGRTYDVTGMGYAPIGEIREGGPVTQPPSALRALLTAGLLCNDAVLHNRNGMWAIDGDPTEGALLAAAAKVGLLKATLTQEHRTVGEIPFDSERRMMTVVRVTDGAAVAYVKGAPGAVLPRCSHVLTTDGLARPLEQRDREEIQAAEDAYARRALRVLAVASRTVPREASLEAETIERDLTCCGLVAMHDPIRPEAGPAVAALRTAGIQVVMVTGDHRNTAQAIAKELGLLDHGPDSATGSELDALNDEELRRRVSSIGVFARVTAEHKFRIVRAWQAGGAVVAMTGDGVNDAPALKQADVGIAMGLAGTDVTKEAADMVVTDDNIASIAAAVEEGRIIYANIQKAVSYLLSHNIGEIGVMLGAGLLALPLPLTAVQILWINLVTDGLPALALALDPKEPDVMQQRPRARDARLFTRDRLALVIGRGVVMAAIGLAVFIAALYAADMSLESSRTVMFTVLVLTQLFQAPIWRSDRLTLAELGLFSNRPLIGAIAVSAALQIVILTAEPLHPIFQVADLTLGQWVAAVAIAFMPVPLWEWLKARRRSTQ